MTQTPDTFTPQQRQAILSAAYILPMFEVELFTNEANDEGASIGPANPRDHWYFLEPAAKDLVRVSDWEGEDCGHFPTGELREAIYRLVQATTAKDLAETVERGGDVLLGMLGTSRAELMQPR